MGIRSNLKAAAVHGLHAMHVPRLAGPALGVKGAILTFHEIHESAEAELWTGCEAKFLEASIRWFRNSGWDIVTLDEALRRLRDDEDKRQFAVFTFDDAYRDNFTRALPILRREQVPFTMYVPTASITRELYAWWLGLRELVRANDEIDVACLGITVSCTDLPSKRAALSMATEWAYKNYDQVSQFGHTFSKYGISLRRLCDRYFLNEDELKSVAAEPLSTIGAHTVSHVPLSTLGAADISRELIDNRAYLEGCLNRPIDHFAYPYGSAAACGAREASLAREAGFVTAVTTSNRPLFKKDLAKPHALPRISFHSRSSTTAHLDVETSGLTRATVRNLFLRPATHSQSKM
ncbi:MAG TPA: polysaccharide deacetylase family protein [Pseudolabrys sp.]|nr:polysaccharide deacetylase family protein [Pseudolabrys sp.]